jgi:hypothetical protein
MDESFTKSANGGWYTGDPLVVTDAFENDSDSHSEYGEKQFSKMLDIEPVLSTKQKTKKAIERTLPVFAEILIFLV